MLRVYVTPDGQQPFLLSFERAHLRVGSAADNEVRLQGTGVSGRHFILRQVGVDVVIEDCNSRNGTYVNKLKVTAPKVLGATDVIEIAGFQVRLVAVAGQTEVVGEGLAPGRRSFEGRGWDGGPDPRQEPGEASAGSVGAVARAAEPPGREEPATTGRDVVELPPEIDPARVAGLVTPRALAWHERADPAHLLRGEELREAKLWSASGARARPAATQREQTLIEASMAAGWRQGLWRCQVALLWLAATVAGGWTARGVLAGGPDAYAPGLSRWAVEQYQERLTTLRRAACQETSAVAAEEALIEGQQSAERGLARAAEALRCTVEFDDLRGTAAERAVRALLGRVQGYALERGEGAVQRVAASPLGQVMAWGRADGTVVLWSMEPWSGAVHEGDGTPLKLLAISGDGGRLVAVAESGTVRVWNLRDDAATPRRVSLDRPRGDVGAVAISADGGRLAIASASQAEVRAFDLDAAAAPAPAARLQGLGGPAELVTVSADGGRVFASSGTSLVGWRFAGDRVVGKPQVLAGHEGALGALSLMACSKEHGERWLVSGDANGEVRMWELRGRGRVVLTGVVGGVRALAATPSCHELVAAGARELRVWDLRGKEPDRTPREVQFNAPIGGLALDGDRGLVAAGAKIHACDLVRATCDEYVGHTQAIVAMSLSEQSGWTVTGAGDGSARLWDVRARAGLQSVQGHHEAPVRAMATSEDGRMLVAAGADAKLWQIQGMQAPRLLRTLPGGPQSVLRAATLSSSGIWAATTADDGVLMLWQIGEGDGETAPPMQLVAGGSLGRLGFSDDGAWLVGSGPEATCAVDLRGVGTPTCVGFGGGGDVDAQAFIPGTHHVALGTEDRDVRIVDLDGLSLAAAEQRLGRGKGRVRSLVGSPDGRWLVAFGENIDGRLWDLSAVGAPMTQLGALVETTQVALFTPDREWLIVGTGPKLLAWRLGQLDTSPTLVREGLESSVTALAISPDGATLLTGGADGKVRAWDFARLEDDTPVEFGGHTEKVTQIAAIGDGTLVVSAGRDATVHVWPRTPQRLWQLVERVRGGVRIAQ